MNPVAPLRDPWRWTTAAVVTVGTFVALAAGSVSHRPLPAPVPATAEATRFSAERAAQHVAVIAREPHPTGSPAARDVARYIQARVAETGLQPVIQRATYVEHGRIGQYRASAVTNILARLPGRVSHRAVLLASHYDSVEGSPGAADDGAAVAAMLEVLRALRAGAPLANDVIFLWTDAEESGLIGAKVFVRQHPWAADVAVAFNFDARGNQGPAILLESSDRLPGWTIDHALHAAPYLVGDSLASTLYARLPNSTDFNVWRTLHVPGANFVLAEGWTTYHAAQDTATALDPRSLQHEGDLMYALATRFGVRALDGAEAGPGSEAGVVFNPPALSAVSWPRRPLTAFVLLASTLFLLCLGWAWRRGRVSLAAVALGFVVPLIAGALSVVAGQFVVEALRASLPGVLVHHSVYTWGLGLVCVGLTAAALFLARAPRFIAGLFAGHVCVLVALFLVTLATITTAPHVIGIPLVICAAAFGVMTLAVERPRPAWMWGALCLSGVALLFVAPLVWMITLAAPGREYLALVLLPLLVGLCLPMRLLMPRGAFALGAIAVAVGSVLILRLVVMAPDRGSAGAPGDVTYVANVEAFPDWYVSNRRDRGRRAITAVYQPASTPLVQVVDDRPEGRRRRVRLRIDGAVETAELSLRITSPSFVDLEQVDGVPVNPDAAAAPRQDYVLDARGFLDPFEITLLADAAPISIQVVRRMRTLTVDAARRLGIAPASLARAGPQISPFIVQTFDK